MGMDKTGIQVIKNATEWVIVRTGKPIDIQIYVSTRLCKHTQNELSSEQVSRSISKYTSPRASENIHMMSYRQNR